MLFLSVSLNWWRRHAHVIRFFLVPCKPRVRYQSDWLNCFRPLLESRGLMQCQFVFNTCLAKELQIRQEVPAILRPNRKQLLARMIS